MKRQHRIARIAGFITAEGIVAQQRPLLSLGAILSEAIAAANLPTFTSVKDAVAEVREVQKQRHNQALNLIHA